MTRIVSIVTALAAGVMAAMPVHAQENDEMDAAAERLRELLRDAADSGYVSMRGQAAAEAAVEAAEDDNEELEANKPLERSLRGGEETAPVRNAAKCQIADMFSYAEYEDDPTYDDIFKLRNGLINIRGAYDVRTGENLAKTYLALAMPEEALALEREIGSQRIDLASAMAKSLLGRGGDYSDDLAEYVYCTEKAGLWVAVSYSKTDPAKALEYTAEYLYLLTELPPELQFSLSTQLGILAADEGEFGLARQLLDKAKKLDHSEDPAILFLESLIDTNRGEEAGLEKLQQVAQTQSPVQARALITLGEISADTPYRNYARDLDLVSTQYRGLSESQSARLMNIRFLAEEGRYQEAIDTARLDFPDPGTSRTTARDSIAAILLGRLHQDDLSTRFQCLDTYSRNFDFFHGFPAETDLRLAAANAAMEFELPQMLAFLLKDHDFAAQQSQVDYLKARAALLEGRADLAWSICSLYEGEEAFDRLSVEAAIAINDPAAALDALARLPQTDAILTRSARVAWNAGLWDRARDYYAELLLDDSNTSANDRHNLAAYMTGEEGGFHRLPLTADILEIEKIFNSYTQERQQLAEYLDNG